MGGRPRRTANVDELIEIALPALTERLIEQALGGDVHAAAVIFAHAASRRNLQ